MIELDIQLSKDRKIVVIHDETLERTTTARAGWWTVLSRRFETRRRVLFGHQFSERRSPLSKRCWNWPRARSWSTSKSRAHSRAISGYGTGGSGTRGGKKGGMLDRVIFSSFNPVSLERIQKKRAAGLGRLSPPPRLEFLSEVTREKDWQVLNLRNSFLTRGKSRKSIKKGSRSTSTR